MKDVYGYVRVSTVRQGFGVSLEVQQETIERFAAQHNFRVVQWFVEKVTAAKEGRPLFSQMVKLLKARKADGVIMHKIDRSARNLKDWSILTDLIEGSPDMEVHFAHENFDLRTRGGRLAGDIQAAVAADFIRNNRQETCKGLDGRLQQGIWPFYAPTGYVNNGKGRYKTPHRVQGPLVTKAFELYATNKYSLKTLVSKMNTLGMKNAGGRPMKVSTLSNILNNPFYMGVLKSKRGTFKGGHRSLVSPELFKCVQVILRGNTNQMVIRHSYQFRKQIRCVACSHTLTAERQKGMIYYRCHTSGCVTKSIRETIVQSRLEEAFAKVEFLPEEEDMLNDVLSETERGWAETQEKLISSLTLQLEQVKARMERLTDCYVEGSIDREAFEKRKQALAVETREKEASLQELMKDKERIFCKARKFFELAKSLTGLYENANPEKKRRMVEIATSNLSVEGKNLGISMRSPFLEMFHKGDIHFGAHLQDALRIDNSEVADIACDPLTARKPLAYDQLKNLVEIVLGIIAKLPDDNPLNDYEL